MPSTRLPMPSTPALLAGLLLAAAPVAAVHAQSDDGDNDGRPAFTSPASIVSNTARAAGRSAIPQPGEGFPKALAFETEAPIRVPFVREGQVVRWEDAPNYLGGDTITVQGRIVDAFQVPNGPCLLKFDAKNRDAFLIAAFLDAGDLKDPPERLYRNRIVRVTGPVTDYKGNPQMRIDSASQIEIVGAGR